MTGTSDSQAICNLLYRYAELLDAGRLDDLAGDLFAHTRFVIGAGDQPTLDSAAMISLMRQTTVIYSDGTPRTKHVITNPIVEINEDGDRATCRSYYTVFQQMEDLPLQAIVSGRYHDRFERVEGCWRFAERDYTLVDFVGNTSHHLRFGLKPRSR